MRQLILDEICNLISGLRMTPSRTFRPTGFVQIRLQSLSHGYSEFQEHFSLCNHNSTHTKHTILESCVLISMYINVQDYWGRVESIQVQVLGLGPGPRVSRAWYFRTFYVNDCTYRSLFYVEHYKKLACPVKLDCP